MDISTFTASRKTLTVPGGDIAYTEFGDGPAALFVHGLATSGALWRNVIERLAAASRCIAIDLPAHGGSQARKDASVAGMANAVAELCDGLGLGQVDLVGNDTGGAVAQIFAARHPGRLRSLSLTNCDTEGNFPPPGFVPLVETARRGELAPVLAAIAADPAQWPAARLPSVIRTPRRCPMRCGAPTTRRPAGRNSVHWTSSGFSPRSTPRTCRRPSRGSPHSPFPLSSSGETMTRRSA